MAPLAEPRRMRVPIAAQVQKDLLMSPLWMFPALLLAILTGFPVALTMLSLAVIFGLHSFGFEGLQHQFIQKIEETATAQVLAAVPLFIFMGAMFEASGIASRLFDAIQMWTGACPAAWPSAPS